MSMEPILTPRLLEILALVVTGMRTREIALELGTSVNTVQGQLSWIFRELGVRIGSMLL